MDILLVAGLFLTLYGIAGIFGFQITPEKYKGHAWTKQYIRSQGISCLLLGIPWLVFSRLAVYFSLNMNKNILCIVMLVLAVPCVIFTFFKERKFRALLGSEDGEEDRLPLR